MGIADQISTAVVPLLSVEFFPPRTDSARHTFKQSARRLATLHPDFVSVTCGAGGSAAGPTLEVCGQLRETGFSTVMPHCTCVGMSRRELAVSTDRIVASGFENIMALRGDPPAGNRQFVPPPGGFRYAADLVAFLRERHSGLCIGVAGYPEKHPEAYNRDEDVRHLKRKVDAGANLVVTQLFLHNHVYFEFLDRCRSMGLSVPVIPGILPVLSLDQIDRMRRFCEFHVPSRLLRRLEAAQGNPAEAARAGIHWAVDQIQELVAAGVPGIHLYLLNRDQTAFDPELFDCLSEIRQTDPHWG